MIQQKEKPCKGTGKAKGNGCGTPTLFRKYGLCPKCLGEFLYTTPEGKEILSKTTISAKKKVANETKKRNIENTRVAKFQLKTIVDLIAEAKVPFQKLIRIRDHGKSCGCCNKPLPFNIGEYDAGHFKKAENYRGVIFHPHNVNGQTKYCNKYLDGNEASYAEKLPKTIGHENFNNLIELATKTKDHQWDKELLFNMKEYYKTELKQVEKGTKNINDVDFSIGILQTELTIY